MLNEKRLSSKWEALAETTVYTDDKNDRKYFGTLQSAMKFFPCRNEIHFGKEQALSSQPSPQKRFHLWEGALHGTPQRVSRKSILIF